ncbi:MAG TPA: autotransporter domain-containing protein [Candidatus Methylacidiphilales bacterium]|nr:autotransporter domain-containing protein [Candidatus Methylacidiphilales bacterium]
MRAIQAAYVALFLAAAASRAEAQTFTPPFVVNGSSVTATAAGTYPSPVGFYDNVNTYSSISVSSGVIINSTAEYTGTINNVFADINATTQSLSNAGTLSIDTAAGPFQAAVNLNNQAGTSVTVTNSGTMTSTNNSFANFALNVASTTGNITVSNSGTMSANGSTNSSATALEATSGSLSFTNTAGGTVTLGGGATGYLVNAITGNNGNVTFSNAGTMTSSDNGVLLETNTGTVQASNTGTIEISGAASDGIFVGAAGPVSVTNSGAITGSNSNYGISVLAGTSAVSLSNSGNISGVAHGLGAFSSGPLSLTNTGTITATFSGIYGGSGGPLTVTNSGVINSTGSGIYLFNPATVRDSGNITSARDSISVPSGSAVTLSGRPIINNIISGGATIVSTSTLDFNITVPAAEFAPDQAKLITEINQYKLNGGGDATIGIGSLDYLISNFAADGLIDSLVASRLYSNVPGFSGLGTALDNMGTNPTSVAILTALDNVSDAGLPNALAELSPKDLEVFRNVAFDNNTFYVQQLNNHLANLRDGLTGFDTSALSLNTSNMDPSLSQIKDHLIAYNPAATPGLISDISDPILGVLDTKDMKSMQVATEPSTRWSTFISGNVILASLDNSAPYQNTDYTTGAVTAGADYRLDDHFTVGALFSYAHSGIDLDYRNSKATVDSYAPGVYASYVDGGWYANGLATYVRNSYTEDREIDIPGIVGDNHGATSGNQGTGNLTGGYEFQSGSFKYGPMATVEYVHLDINSIQEQGPTALDIHDQSADSLRTLLGFEGRYATAVDSCYGKWILTPHFSASWQHECLDNSNGITSQFSPAGGGSFNVQTDQPERDSAFLDAGLDIELNKTATVFLDYQVQAGQDDFFAQSAQGGVRISF